MLLVADDAALVASAGTWQGSSPLFRIFRFCLYSRNMFLRSISSCDGGETVAAAWGGCACSLAPASSVDVAAVTEELVSGCASAAGVTPAAVSAAGDVACVVAELAGCCSGAMLVCGA